ncbi:MAG: phage portal protein [Bryobacteraceae bacterium]|jgi:hypothetical protein
MSFKDRLVHAWNAFTNMDDVGRIPSTDMGPGYTLRPDRTRLLTTNERSIVTSVYTRLATDAASVAMKHVRLDDNGWFVEELTSGLNNCLTVEANLDQGARAFRQDMVMSLIQQGTIAIVPVDTTLNPQNSGNFDILTMRVGEIIQWHPQHVTISLYNERRGRREEITLSKRAVAIVENPFYDIMNQPNSTMQRLIRKLGLLDSVDEQSSSGKLDMVIQLPYVIKSEARRQQAEQRRADIEFQLKGSQYGIAYVDGTEKITQLNRPVENNLLAQIKYLTEMLYGQLGLTPEIMNGTADEKTMLNYQNRTIEPLLTAIVEAMRRSFLTKTARTQKQSIEYFREPFKLVPVGDLAEIADKFTRNEILSSNEIRQVIGMQPSNDPKANQLRNSNMPQSELGQQAPPVGTPIDTSVDPSINEPIRVPSTRTTTVPAIE